MKRFLSLCLFAAIGLLTLPAAADSLQDKCLCTPAGFERRWQDAAQVFSGQVTAIEVQDKYILRGVKDQPVKVTFTVEDGYKKAKSGDTVEVYDSLTHDTCTGYPFELHKKYLVYTYKRLPEVREYWSLYDFPSGTVGIGGLCGGTKPANDPDTLADTVFIQEALSAKDKTSAPETPEDGTGEMPSTEQ